MREPRLQGLLRVVLLLLGTVAVVAGFFTAATGTSGMPGDSSATPNVESELRFYAVFWSAFGVLALLAARSPERQTSLVRGLALFLFLGGVARGLAWLASARPDTQFLVLMALELGLPVFMVWAQARISRRARSA
jgi:uncharacterized protein DUF4345